MANFFVLLNNCGFKLLELLTILVGQHGKPTKDGDVWQRVRWSCGDAHEYGSVYDEQRTSRRLIFTSYKIQTRLPVLPSSNLGMEILTGRDELIDFDDIFTGSSRLLASHKQFILEQHTMTRKMDVHAMSEVHRLGWASSC